MSPPSDRNSGRAGQSQAHRSGAWLRGEAVITISIALMNITTYGYTLVASRTLGPKSYGAFASLMATLLVLGVVQLGLQATAARRIASSPARVSEIRAEILGFTYRAAFVLGAASLIGAPLLAHLFSIDLTAALLVPVAIVPLTIMGAQAGILQGERRWRALGALYLAAGVPRLALGTVLLVLRPTETMAMWGVGLAAFAPVVLGAAILRRHEAERAFSATSPPASARVAAPQTGSTGQAPNALRLEALRNSSALLAFFVLSNADVLVARIALTEPQAGLYAGALILTKAVLFLPQFVIIVAFPSMSVDSAVPAGATPQGSEPPVVSPEAGGLEVPRGRVVVLSLTAVFGLGLGVVAGVSVLPGLAQAFIGGPEYAPIVSRLWLFALLGTALAMVQVLVYAVVARQGKKSIYAVWAALAVVIAAGSQASSPTDLVARVLIVDSALLLVLLTSHLATSRGVSARPRAS